MPAPGPEQRKTDNAPNHSDYSPNDSHKPQDRQEVPEHKEDEVKTYNNIEDFVMDTLEYHMGEDFDYDMSDETKQQLYDLFCDMNMNFT